MSYVVLARKWRPKTFEEVVGQQPIIQTLKNAIKSDRVAQAFLFTGPRGVGKTSVARILAKALNCEQGPTPTPCNHCNPCIEIDKTIAPDVFEIDGASNTGVDNIRDLQETIRYLPQKHRYKIFIVDEVHMLSNSAFNAFLKTLEEPPSHVIFIFATTEPHKIIDTVVDRCQRYDFKKISPLLIQQHLQHITNEEKIKMSSDSLQLIAREAEGSLRDAQSMLDQIVTYAGKEIKDEDVADVLGVVNITRLFEISAAVIAGDLEKCMQAIEAVFDHGIDIRQFYRGLIEHFRNVMLVKLSTDIQLFPNLQQNDLEALALHSEDVSLEKLKTLLKILIEGEEYIYRSRLPRIVLEAILLRMATLPSASSLKEILDKLTDLQKNLNGKAAVSEGFSPHSQSVRDFSECNEPIEKYGERKETDPPSEKPIGYSPSSDQESSLEQIWKNLTDFVRKRKPPFASLLDNGRLLRKEKNLIELGFPKNFIFLERLQKKSKRDELSKICEEFFGLKTMVEISVLPPSNAYGNQNSGTGKKQHHDNIRKEAEDHTLIKEALSVFGGSITKIKVLDQ